MMPCLGLIVDRFQLLYKLLLCTRVLLEDLQDDLQCVAAVRLPAEPFQLRPRFSKEALKAVQMARVVNLVHLESL
jgi:hypothetical protein